MSIRQSKSLLVEIQEESRASNGRGTPQFEEDPRASKSFQKQNSTTRSNLPQIEEQDSSKRSTSVRTRVPKLALDSLIEDDSEPASLNLSAICMENTSDKNKYLEEESLLVPEKDEGKELMRLLEQQPEESHFSYRHQQKTHSRLDESSIVTPNVLVDTTSYYNKENQSKSPELYHLLKKQSQKYDKALLILQTNFNSYKETTQQQIKGLEEEVSSLKTQLQGFAELKKKLYHTFKNQINSLQNELRDKLCENKKLFEQRLEEHSQETKNSFKKQLSHLQSEFEEKLKRQSYSQTSRRSSGDSKASNRSYQDLVKENRRLKEELTYLWKDYGRNKLGLQL